MAARFEDVRAWQEARKLAVLVYRVTQSRPFLADRALKSQLRRASSSCMQNIAEGFGRLHARELRQGFNVCIGSATEVQSEMYLASDLGLCSHEDFKAVYDQAALVIRLSKAFVARMPEPS